MTTRCPKCGGTTISSRKATSTGRPMDTVACQSCDWSRVVVGALPPAPLSDEALADLLAKAEAAGKTSPTPWAYAPDDAASGWVEDANGATPIGGYDGQWFKAPAEFAAAADPATVSALVREVQRLRLEERTQREAKLLARTELATVIRENNALRKNNERLTKENANLRERAKRAESANAAAQTMAAHWKLKATDASQGETHRLRSVLTAISGGDVPREDGVPLTLSLMEFATKAIKE